MLPEGKRVRSHVGKKSVCLKVKGTAAFPAVLCFRCKRKKKFCLSLTLRERVRGGSLGKTCVRTSGRSGTAEVSGLPRRVRSPKPRVCHKVMKAKKGRGKGKNAGRERLVGVLDGTSLAEPGGPSKRPQEWGSELGGSFTGRGE